MFKHDLGYKLVAIATAFTLWLYVQGERNPRVTPSIPGIQLEVKNLAKGSVITSGTDEVAITLEGAKSLVDAISTEKLQAWVDLAGRPPGIYTLPVNVTLPKNAPPDIKASANPSTVTLTLESVDTRVMSVDVNYTTPPPVGYNLGQPKISPPSAYVSGRSALVDRVRRLAVMVDPSSLTNPGGTVDGYFNVVALDASGNEVKDVTIDPDRTRVRLAIDRVPSTKIAIVSPTFSGQPKFGYAVRSVTVKPDEITIKGRPEAIFPISTILTDEIDVDGATTTVARDATLRVPPGVEIDGAHTVHVVIKIEPKEVPQ